jgi:hypothetical protein
VTTQNNARRAPPSDGNRDKTNRGVKRVPKKREEDKESRVLASEPSHLVHCHALAGQGRGVINWDVMKLGMLRPVLIHNEKQLLRDGMET